jgi:CheY-like chemotaxis protein
MGTLAAGVAHEINNPLSFVLYNLESLCEDMPKLTDAMRRCHALLRSRVGVEAVDELLGCEEDSFSPATFDDVAARFRDAVSGTQRIKDIARGLGTFSRVERTAVEPANLHHAVENAINMAYNEIKYRARLVKDFGQVPMVLGSDGKLAQVFLNLLINAAHAIGEGHAESNQIRIRTWADDRHVFAEVSDTGKGIAPEHQGKIFEAFFTTKGTGVGTGLGLSISKSIIAGFGGEISFRSELGQGTRFLIRLPRVPSDWQAGHPAAPAPVSDRPKLRGRLLVVDDEAGIRAAIVRMLGREHEVVTASSGKEARALLENDRRFDLVFCDLMMPELSGMQLHAWLSAEDAALAEQIVFMTGGAFTPGASEYLRKVGNLQVEKPFDSGAFKKLTRELILAARAKQEA